MHRANRSTDPGDERGSAPVEFIFAGLLLLAPLIYLMVALGSIQSHALGTEAGARHLARAIATAADAAEAEVRADALLSALVREYGMEPEHIRIDVECRPAVAPCPSAGTMIVVTVTARVALPLVPDVLGIDQVASIPIEATAVQRVSRFWGGP